MSICILDSRGKRATTAGLCRLVFDYDIIAVLLLHVRARTVHVDRSVLLTGDQRKCALREFTTTLHNGCVGTGRGFMINAAVPFASDPQCGSASRWTRCEPIGNRADLNPEVEIEKQETNNQYQQLSQPGNCERR